MCPNLRATEVSQLSTVTTTTFWSEGPCGRPAWFKIGCRTKQTHDKLWGTFSIRWGAPKIAASGFSPILPTEDLTKNSFISHFHPYSQGFGILPFLYCMSDINENYRQNHEPQKRKKNSITRLLFLIG